MNLFDFPRVRIEKKIRLIEMFAGVGSQAMALRDIGADFEHYKVIEFDKYCVNSYNSIHHTNFETMDIKNVHGADLGIVEKDRFTYLLTYSFPCTDLSVAGKMLGMSRKEWEEGKATRSGLLWEVERILTELPKEQLPDILLMENVPQVHAEQNKADFDLWCEFLRKKGYQNFRKDLNARDYGIPQNRERCFMVSVLADDFVDFEFPKPIRLEKVMKDFLEDSVAEKYYINSPKARQLIEELIANGTLESKKKILITENREQRTENRELCEPLICVLRTQEKSKSQTVSRQNTMPESATCRRTEAVLLSERGTKFERIVDIACTLMARDYKGFGNQAMNGVIEETKCVGGLSDSVWGGKQYHQQDRVYKGDIALAEPANIPGGSYKYIVAMRGRGENNEQQLEPNTQGVVNALTTVQKDNLVLVKQATKKGYIECKEGGVADLSYPSSKTRRGRVQDGGETCPAITAESTGLCRVESRYRIRKLTPRECWRLMGFSDADFDKAEKVCSNTQLYKQAGNSIIRQVLIAIFLQLNIQGIKNWNDRTKEEREEFYKW